MRIVVEDARVFDPLVAWLRDTHVGDVCAAGARDADLLVMDSQPGEAYVVEAHYRFASRDAFAEYERTHAQRLRGLGLAELKRLGVEPGRGVHFQRATGTALAWRKQ